MHGSTHAQTRNILLSALPAADFATLEPHLELLGLPRGTVIAEPGRPVEWVWFPASGIGSVIAVSPEGNRVEVGLFGRDAMSPAASVLGIDAVPYHIFMQVQGDGFRLPAAVFRSALEGSAGMRSLFNRYLHTFNTQTAYTALSNAIHQIDERCARWLLMTHDRGDTDDFSMTHEFLSLMLAVRRPSVTAALHVLEGNRLIRADRGSITIRDRAGLEEYAGDAYGRSEAEYARLIGPMKRSAA